LTAILEYNGMIQVQLEHTQKTLINGVSFSVSAKTLITQSVRDVFPGNVKDISSATI
jgi:hypothetical protein